MLLSSAISVFLDHVEIAKGQSLKTVRNYAHYLRRFEQFCGNIPVEEITLELIGKYRITLNRLESKDADQLLGKKTQNYHIIAIRALLKYLVKQGVEVLSPDRIDLGKTEARQVDFLEREELESLFQSIDTTTPSGLRDRALVEMLYSTGLRVSEIASLDRAQLSLERGEFSVRGKGKKLRIVFLSERCREWLEKYLKMREDEMPALFINNRKRRETLDSRLKTLEKAENGRLSTVSIEAIVRKYARLAGIVKKVTPHTLRHTFATQMLMAGADIRSVQELLGHASIATTQIYTHITNQKLREIHQKFHS